MKKPSLLLSSRRMCGVIGILWLLAILMCQPFHLPQIARWLFLSGVVLGAALLVMLFVQHLREKHS